MSIRTSRTPSHNIHGLCVFDEGGEIGDFPLLSVAVNLPELFIRKQPLDTSRCLPNTYPHIVVAASCRQSSLSVGLEVCRVYGCILVVPGHQQRCSLHRGSRYGSGPFDGSISKGERSVGAFAAQEPCAEVMGRPGQEVRCLGCVGACGGREGALLSVAGVAANECSSLGREKATGQRSKQESVLQGN